MRPRLGRVEGGRGEEGEGLRGGREVCGSDGWIRDVEGNKNCAKPYTIFHINLLLVDESNV